MALRLGVSPSWLRKEAKANRIPHLNADGVLLFSPDAVMGALAARAAGGRKPTEAARQTIIGDRR